MLKQFGQWLTDIAFHEVLRQRQLGQVVGTLNDWNSAFTLEVVLTNLQYLQACVLAKCDSDALTAIGPEVIVIDAKRLQNLVLDQKS